MKKNKNIFIFSTLLIISYVNIYFFYIRFSVADDYLINNIIDGTFGNTYDYQLLYVNNILGVIFKIFYHIIPNINLYTFYLILLLCICFTKIINYIINNKKYILISILFLLYILTLFNITYTIIAYLCVGVGLLELIFNKQKNYTIDYLLDTRKVIAENHIHDVKNKYANYRFSLMPCILENFSSVFLIINGVMLRNQVIVPVFAVFGTILFARLLKEKDYKKVKKMLVLLIAISILDIGGVLMYKTENVLNEFKNWQEASIKIRDYKQIDYDKYKSIFEEIGWSENDLKLFYSWNFADKEKFNQKAMETVVENLDFKDRYSLTPKTIILDFLKQYTVDNFKYNNVYIVIFFTIFIIATINSKSKKECIYVFLVTLALNLALIVRCRYPFRVVYPQYLLAIIFYIYEITSQNIQKNNKKKFDKYIFVCTVIAVITFSTFYVLKYKQNSIYFKKLNDENKAIVNALKDDGNLYLMDSYTYNELTMNYKITERKSIGEYKSFIKIGGGDCFSKRYYNYIKRFDLKYRDNLFKNLKQKNVYYMGQNYEYLTQYLKENVDEKYNLVEVKKINNKAIYKYEDN